MVGAQARQRGEQDAGQRGAQRQMQDVALRHLLRTEGKGQQRHDDDTAADTEQSGHDPGDGAGGQIKQKKQHDSLQLGCHGKRFGSWHNKEFSRPVLRPRASLAACPSGDWAASNAECGSDKR